MASSDFLIEALPPVTDYLTYLTLIEYKLSKDQLPALNEVLQDSRLTINIGWDLVHLLLPLLPESEQCLQTIAKLGNPREVVLKVTECLRLLSHASQESETGEVHDQDHQAGGSVEKNSESAEKAMGDDLHIATSLTKFAVLLSMLEVLHPRIKTKYPSRFIATSLQSTLVCMMQLDVSDPSPFLDSAISLVRTLSRTRRPSLPPRNPSQPRSSAYSQASAPDPEGADEAQDAQDLLITKRLSQAFVSCLIEFYTFTLSTEEDVPGFGLSARLFERSCTGKVIPGTQISEKADEGRVLLMRLEELKKLISVAKEVEITATDMWESITSTPDSKRSILSLDDPPDEPNSVTLSPIGCLIVLGQELLTAEKNAPLQPIFPSHSILLQNNIGLDSHGGPLTSGMEPDPIVDAVLAHGLLAVEANLIGKAGNDDEFNEYLQKLSLISVNTLCGSLRYYAQYLTSIVLRSNKSDVSRLAFIRDTLQHCPYEDLKAVAVGWIKDETLNAPGNGAGSAQTNSVFGTPVALNTLSPYMFVDVDITLSASLGLLDRWAAFKSSHNFFLAVLNFYYLLLSSDQFRDPLDIKSLHTNNDVGGSFLAPLSACSVLFQRELAEGQQLAKEEGPDEANVAKAQLKILDDALERVQAEVVALALR